jgi:hypothetical protein
MKKGVVFIAAFASLLYAASCSKPSCVPPVINAVSFYATGGYIPDTSASVVKAKKGSQFGFISEVFPNIKLDKNKVMLIPYKGNETYDYDWQITLNPSGKVYKITDIKHDDENPNRTNCVSTVYYKLNDSMTQYRDSLQTLAGSPYSMTPTTTPQIKIQY